MAKVVCPKVKLTDVQTENNVIVAMEAKEKKINKGKIQEAAYVDAVLILELPFDKIACTVP